MRYLLPIFLLLIVLLPEAVQAQSRIQIDRVARMQTLMVEGEQIRKFYNAQLTTDNVTVVCDSAWQFLNTDELRAFGNIQIDTETENIWADTLYYYTNRDVSLLRGRVVILQDSSTLFGNRVDYNFETKVAEFQDGIRLEDNQGTLTALQGTYFQNQDSAVFRHNVQLQDSSQYAEGDSLYINRKRKYLELFSNVFVVDSTNNGLLTGEYLEADSSGMRYVEGNAYLRKIDSDSTESDTTHIYAQNILMIETDTLSTIDASDDVKVWSANFSSLSDTLDYNSQTEIFDLYGAPKAWHKNIQLNGPFISVQMDSNEVKELKAFVGAFAVQEDTVTGRLNQLRGDTLTAWFEYGDISEIQIYPFSEILYHTKDDNDNPDGAMEGTSPKTTLYFEEGELIQAKMGQNQGFFLPEYPGLVTRRLSGFEWNPELRPEKPITAPVPRWEPIPTERPFPLPVKYLRFIETLESN